MKRRTLHPETLPRQIWTLIQSGRQVLPGAGAVPLARMGLAMRRVLKGTGRLGSARKAEKLTARRARENAPILEIPGSVEEFSGSVEELFGSVEEFFPAAKELFPAAEELFPAAEEFFPAAEELFPAAEELFPAAKELLPAAEELFPAAEEFFPAAEEFFPTIEELFPAVGELFPAAEELFPAVEEAPAGKSALWVSGHPDLACETGCSTLPPESRIPPQALVLPKTARAAERHFFTKAAGMAGPAREAGSFPFHQPFADGGPGHGAL